jgi:hypothetical protein
MMPTMNDCDAQQWWRWLPAEPCRSASAAERRLARGRPILHQMAQSATLVVGIIERLALTPADSADRSRLMADLKVVAEELLRGTQRLQAVLHEP